MNLDILYRNSVPADKEPAFKMLKTAVLFSYSIRFSHHYCWYFRCEDDFSQRSDPIERLILLKEIVPLLLGKDSGKYIRLIDQLRETIMLQRTHKHNLRGNVLSTYMLLKSQIATFEEVVFNACRKFIRDNKMDSLLEFNRRVNNCVIFFWMPMVPKASVSPERDFLINTIAEYKSLRGIVVDRKETPFIRRACAVKTSVYKEGFDTDDFDGRLIICPKPLFSLPSADMLKAEQMAIARQEFFTSLKPLYEFFDAFPQSENGNPAEGVMISCSEKDLIAGLLDNIALLQQAVENNTYVKYLHNFSAPDNDSAIHLGLCSMNTLFKLYRETGELDAQMELYFRDLECRDLNLNRCCPVLVAG